MRRIRRHLTYANVMVTILAFIVLTGGTAVALNGSNTVQSDDLGPGAQVKAADVAANSVNGSDIADGSITGADLAPSAMPKGRKIISSCNPTSTTFVDCGTLTINLARPSRILIVASGMWHAEISGTSDGNCRIGVNGVPFGPDAQPGEITRNSDHSAEQSVTLTSVTDPNLGAGNHTIGLACNQRDGDIVFDTTYVSAVVLGAG